jgi:acetyltransferase-like isoleucine patch superfamily enzyme
MARTSSLLGAMAQVDMAIPLDKISVKWQGLQSRRRVLVFRMAGMQIGRGCRLERIRVRHAMKIRIGDCTSLTEGCWLWPSFPELEGIRIQIGQYNYFNRDCMIDACSRIEIGNHNMLGPGVYITDANHIMEPSRPVTETSMDKGTTVIGNGCWIGARAIILKDVCLGDNCTVAAGAVVTKSFPAGSVVAGVPARRIR